MWKSTNPTFGVIGAVVIVVSLSAVGVALVEGAVYQEGPQSATASQETTAWNAEYGTVHTHDSAIWTGPVPYVEFYGCNEVVLYGAGRYHTVSIALEGERYEHFALAEYVAGVYTLGSGEVESISVWAERPDEIEAGNEPEMVFDAPCGQTASDADGDGLTDDKEQAYGTDPTDPDTDGDLYWDGDEVHSDTSPTSPTDHPIRDSDGDGFINTEEIGAGTDPQDPDSYPASGTSPDGDSLTDAEEQQYGTDPADVDTDGDLYWDGDEVDSGTDPTDPADHPIRDSDGDGFLNTEEIGAGTDPHDPNSTP